MRKTKTASLIANIGAALFLTLTTCHGQGTLQVTFDGPPAAPPGSSISLQTYYEGGMSFSPIPPQHDFSRVGVGHFGDPQNGSAYLRAALTQSLMFSFTNGSVFNLLAVDLAEYNSGFQSPLLVQFVGYKLDGSTITTDLTTDGIIDGTGPLADFQTFYFGPEFSRLTRVEIPTWGWSLDNLVVSVPEPSAASIGLLGFALWRLLRRRHAEQT